MRYVFGGITRRYVPDFLVRLTNGKMLVIEVKGVEDDMSRAKHEALCEWVRAVNTTGNYGEWSCEVVHNPAEIDGVIACNLKRAIRFHLCYNPNILNITINNL